MKKLSLRSKIIIVSAAFVLVAVIACLTVIAFNNNIYKGVSVAGIDLGGKTVDEAHKVLAEETFFSELPAFVYDGREFTLDAEQIDLKCDNEKTAQIAHAYGRDSNFFVRIANIFNVMFNPVDLPMEISYNKQKLDKIFDEQLKDLRIPLVEPEIRLEGERLYIKNGSQGLDVSADKLKKDLAAVAAGNTDKIELVLETVNPTLISAQKLYDEYAKEATSADYTISDMRISYTDSVDGLDFDIAEAERIIQENVKNSREYFIPVTIIKPDMTAEQLDRSMFGDCLGTYTTKYNPAEIGRTKNVTLASNKISNIVLKTGDEFSYNSIVGERTLDRGFSNAKVYAGGDVVDGLGGGICQVSSTLYNAVLYADLEIVSRTCHSLPVAYVPLGRDATVSYGSIDFIFKNPYENPVKITSSVGGGVLTVSVYGKKTLDKKVEISTERLSTTPFSVREEVDQKLLEGQTKVKQAGSDGAVVNTYKKVIENGTVVSNKLIHKSVYSPITKVVLVAPAAEVGEDTKTPAVVEPGLDGEDITDIPASENTSEANETNETENTEKTQERDESTDIDSDPEKESTIEISGADLSEATSGSEDVKIEETEKTE